MLITDKELMNEYGTSKRLWQGIPSIEVTKKGRVFLTFYSGGTKEEIGNYVLLIQSDDGKKFSEPVLVVYEEGHRCFDPCIWIDPLGRLWLTWARYPDDGTFAAICENPDADELIFSEPFFIGNYVMMNKPTVLSTGEWLFPLAVWNEDRTWNFSGFCSGVAEKGSYVYSSVDEGKTFQKLGHATIRNRSFDENMILEMKDKSLRMFVRRHDGIGASDSFDGGLHWGMDYDTGYGGPSSRFHITRLKSGRILLINHYNFEGRNNLTAMLSEDDGKTFPYRLLLDERAKVSYPDAKEAEDGFIYITYDRERGAFLNKMEDVMSCAREILMAKITEDDILNGCLLNKASYLKFVANKLTSYDGDMKNPFCEEYLYNDTEYATHLSDKSEPQKVIEEIFDTYHLNCTNMHHIEAEKLDKLVKKYKKNSSLQNLSEIISLVRETPESIDIQAKELVVDIRGFLDSNLEQNHCIEEIAKEFGVSSNYLQHVFKKFTGTTIVEYRNARRLTKAKILLRGCDEKIIEIATECGYENASYFSEVFKKEVRMSPSQYRKKYRGE